MTYAIMSNTDYKGITDTVRAKTGTTALLKSAEVAPAIRSIELSTTSLTLTVTTEAGATVTATKGSLSVTAVATNGTAVLKLKEAGEWTVTASLNGETSTVLVSVTDSYELTLDYFSPDPVFANNDWATIIKACQLRLVPSTWVVADQKPMLINGTNYAIDIIGKDHDDYADGSGKAPLTLQMHDCYGTGYGINSANNNSGGWKNCVMRNTHLPAIMALMPGEVQAAIKEVNKVSGVGGTINSVETVADKLFLLSEWEVFGAKTYAVTAENVQTQYAYYLAGNSTIKKIGSTNNNWWERSPHGSSTARWCNVRNTGGVYYASVTASAGIAFAFCF